MSATLIQKATMYIRRMDSDQLKEIMDRVFERYKELNPERHIKYCRLDRRRVFWALWENGKFFYKGYKAKYSGVLHVEDKDPASIRGSVMSAVIEETGKPLLDNINLSYTSAHITEDNDIKKYYRKLIAEKKVARPMARTKDTSAVEFVYSPGFALLGQHLEWLTDIPKGSFFDFDVRQVLLTYKVVKKTKKEIFISKIPEGKETNSGYLAECFILNKKAFERNGKYYSRSADKIFYKDRNAAVAPDETKILLEMLDIEGDITKESLKAAYREKVKELHPDKGGNAEAFMRLKEAYETVIKFTG